MAVSLEEFRARYPTAALTSELLTVHADHFVIRVTIQTQEAGVATGMAADTTLEVAEDRARQRALHGLGYGETQLTVSGAIPAAPVSVSNDIVDRMPEVRQSPLANVTDVPDDAESPTATVPTTHASPLVSRDKPATVSDSPSKPVKTTRNSSEPAINGKIPTDSPQLGPEMAEAPTAMALPPPINLSDVIAQTDVELRRLGWSVADGREYLEGTYGKRSRHDLTDEELLAFLLHLEGLSSSQTEPE